MFFIVRGTDANLSFSRELVEPLGIPGLEAAPRHVQSLATVTRKIQRLPLRTALYLLARDSGSRVTWELEPDGFQRGIKFIAK